MTSRYSAPFLPGGSSPIDEVVAQRLLNVALAGGGEYADLFFEYRASGGFAYEEGILKNANRGVTMGLGVRVQKGDATGYAYTEELLPESMTEAARTAAQIASGGRTLSAPTPNRRSLPR